MSALAVSYILSILQALPTLIAAGSNAVAEIEALIAFMQAGKDPTPQQWADANAMMMQALQNVLNKPAE